MDAFNNLQALSEGWDIFERDEPWTFEIQRLDDPASVPGLDYSEPKFASDEEAVEYVFSQVRNGSEYHKTALSRLDTANRLIREGRGRELFED